MGETEGVVDVVLGAAGETLADGAVAVAVVVVVVVAVAVAVEVAVTVIVTGGRGWPVAGVQDIKIEAVSSIAKIKNRIAIIFFITFPPGLHIYKFAAGLILPDLNQRSGKA